MPETSSQNARVAIGRPEMTHERVGQVDGRSLRDHRDRTGKWRHRVGPDHAVARRRLEPAVADRLAALLVQRAEHVSRPGRERTLHEGRRRVGPTDEHARPSEHAHPNERNHTNERSARSAAASLGIIIVKRDA